MTMRTFYGCRRAWTARLFVRLGTTAAIILRHVRLRNHVEGVQHGGARGSVHLRNQQVILVGLTTLAERALNRSRDHHVPFLCDHNDSADQPLDLVLFHVILLPFGHFQLHSPVGLFASLIVIANVGLKKGPVLIQGALELVTSYCKCRQ